MANVLAGALAVVGVVVMLTCLLTWTAFMLPRPVARAQRQIETHPWQSFFVGLVVLVAAAGTFYLGLTLRPKIRELLEPLFEMLFKNASVARYAGDTGTAAHQLLYISLIPFLIALVIGAAAFARTFAQRADASRQRPVASLVGGAFLLSCSMFFPLIGWFVLLPIVTAISAGAGLLSLLSRDPVPTNG
jgi:hypothetical protein